MNVGIRDREAGITLIEVLVVFVVIAVAAGATMMGFSDRSKSAETEAVRLARNLTLGVDEAMLTGWPLALRWDAAGYNFNQLRTGQSDMGPETWPAAEPLILGLRHDLVQPLELRSENPSIAPYVILSASGATSAVTFNITDGGASWNVFFDGFTAVALAEDNG